LGESGKKKEAEKMSEAQTSSGKKQQRRITGENKKMTANLNEQVTGPRRSRGKKQRRQYKISPTEDKQALQRTSRKNPRKRVQGTRTPLFGGNKREKYSVC
jgi:hypothetical protein